MTDNEVDSSANKSEKCAKPLPNPFQCEAIEAKSQQSPIKAQSNSSTHFNGYHYNAPANQGRQFYRKQTTQQFDRRPQNQPNTFGGKFNKNQSNGEVEKDNSNWCSLCERGFKYRQQLEKHIDQHGKCWYENCKFEGHSELLQKHIEVQHESGLFQKIGKIETDEDIDKWREERRKRYPTRANIEARQLAQAERFKRGEKLNEPKRRFGNTNDRRSAQQRPQANVKNERNTKKKRNRKPRNRNNKNNKNEEKEKLNVSNEVNNIARFSGISALDAPSQSPAKNELNPSKNALSALVGFYGTDSEEESDGEKTNIIEEPKADEIEIIVPKNSLTDQTELFDNESNTNDGHLSESDNSNRKRVHASDILQEDDTSNTKRLKQDNKNEVNDNNQAEKVVDQMSNCDDEPPEEHSIQRDDSDKNSEAIANTTCQIVKNKPQRLPEIKKKRTIFDTTRKIRNQNSLLEKLLQKDIRHERNVLLQCVRYVVENNFFSIGEENKPQEK